MTSSDDTLEQFGRHGETGEKLRALCSRYDAFLAEREVKFSPGADASEIGAEARRLHILTLAGIRLVLDRLREHKRAPEYEEALAKARRQVLADLWHKGRLHRPWIELVNQEFPGDESSEAILEGITTAAPDSLERELVSNEWFEQVWEEVVGFFSEQGYEFEEADRLILIPQVVAIVGVRLQDAQPEGVPMGDLLQEIQEHASQPSHPAWNNFVRHFFPNYRG